MKLFTEVSCLSAVTVHSDRQTTTHLIHSSTQVQSVPLWCSNIISILYPVILALMFISVHESHNGEDDGGGHWLVQMEWHPSRWSVCLPLLIFPCTIKSRSSLLAPAHPGGPGKRAVKRLCACVRASDNVESLQLRSLSSCASEERISRRLSVPVLGCIVLYNHSQFTLKCLTGRGCSYHWRRAFLHTRHYNDTLYWHPFNDGGMSWERRIELRIYTVSQKNVPPLACYNFDKHEWILICFGRNVTNKVGNQKMLYYATSNNLCFCTTWQDAETRKSHISLNWIVLHTQCTCAISSWKKKIVISDVFDSV